MTVTELEHSLFNNSKLDDFLQVFEKITKTYNVFKHVNIFLSLYIYSRVLNNRPPFTNKGTGGGQYDVIKYADSSFIVYGTSSRICLEKLAIDDN